MLLSGVWQIQPWGHTGSGKGDKEQEVTQNHCTMLFHMSIDIFEILKSKNSFLAHFDLKMIIFPLDDAEGPNFKMNIWF